MATDDLFKTQKTTDEEENTGLIASTMKDDTNTTTSNQDWDSGSLEISKDGAFFTPSSSGVNENDPSNVTVAGQMDKLLSKDSLYRTAAETSAKEDAASRGLLNTSMATTAGTAAAIESALPIAEQDAAYYASRGLAEQGGQIQSGLYEKQGEISSRLSSQEASQTSELSAQEAAQEMALTEVELAWNELELEAKMQVEYDRMSQEMQINFDATATEISDSYMEDYMEILLNPYFETDADRQAAIDVLNANTENRYSLAASIAGVELEWTGVPSGSTIYTDADAAADAAAAEEEAAAAAALAENMTSYSGI
uniref:Uncharacterized protein n=2 Tax=viral metagenome TaxID=1070528 RepID=A0A6M3XKH8_9ZZZZ